MASAAVLFWTILAMLRLAPLPQGPLTADDLPIMPVPSAVAVHEQVHDQTARQQEKRGEANDMLPVVCGKAAADEGGSGDQDHC